MAILTLSREVGSGGREIGQAVVDSMGYSLIDKEDILASLKTVGREWERCGRDFDEARPALWERYDWTFRGFRALMQSILLDYAITDKVVIMGRGANFLLSDIPFVLKIRVVAPMEKRVERIMKRESVDRRNRTLACQEGRPGEYRLREGFIRQGSWRFRVLRPHF